MLEWAIIHCAKQFLPLGHVCVDVCVRTNVCALYVCVCVCVCLRRGVPIPCAFFLCNRTEQFGCLFIKLDTNTTPTMMPGNKQPLLSS